jgi:predicted Fe-Mo cluster-binding NifX family protein
MASAISDCEVLISGGMGLGAYESMRALNITPVVTEVTVVETAVRKYIEGNLVDQTDRLH